LCTIGRICNLSRVSLLREREMSASACKRSVPGSIHLLAVLPFFTIVQVAFVTCSLNADDDDL